MVEIYINTMENTRIYNDFLRTFLSTYKYILEATVKVSENNYKCVHTYCFYRYYEYYYILSFVITKKNILMYIMTFF